MLRLPAVFLLLFIAILLIFTVLHLLAHTLASYSDFGELKFTQLLGQLPASLRLMLPGALSLSLVLLFLKNSLEPAPNIIILAIIYTLAGLLLCGGLLMLNLFPPQTSTKAAPVAQYLLVDKINDFGDVAMYPAVVEPDRIRDTFYIDPAGDTNRLAYFRQLSLSFQDNRFKLELPGKVITEQIKNPYQRYLATQDSFSAGLLQLLGRFSQDLGTAARQPDFFFFLSSLVFLFFVMSSSVFIRLTRWPLFNLFFCTLLITGMLLLYSLYTTELLPELGKITSNATFPRWLPTMAFGGLSALFLLIDIIFIPARYRKEGLKGG